VLAGQITGASSSEFGLAGMIWAAVVAAKVSCCTHFEYHRLMYDQDGDFEVTPGHTVGLFAGLLLLHGLLVSRCSGVNVCYILTSSPIRTPSKREISRGSRRALYSLISARPSVRMLCLGVSMEPDGFVVIIICLLALTPRHEMHSANYVFGSDGVINQTGGWNTGLAFMFGLLSVQWTASFSIARRRSRC
jgi:hypothetical protein